MERSGRLGVCIAAKGPASNFRGLGKQIISTAEKGVTMEYRKIMDIIAYYLSEFDRKAFDAFGFDTQTKGFDAMAEPFGKKGSYLRRLRDEYDVVTNSFRRGQCNRPPRSRIIQTTEYLKQFSFEELTEMVRVFLENANPRNAAFEESQSEDLPEALDEAALESILNFKDAGASLKVRTKDQRVRIYNTGIIRQLKKLYGGCCQLCGKGAFDGFDTDISEAHHIAYFADSQNNDASNIIILCPNHHRLIHKLNPIYEKDGNCFQFPDGKRNYVQIDYHLSK